MAAPAWTAHPDGNVIPSQALAASGAVGGLIDLRGAMRGRAVLRATGGGSVSGQNGAQFYVRNLAGNAQGDDRDLVAPVLAVAQGVSHQLSINLDGGYYYAIIANIDPAYAITVSVTSEELSWPS